MNDTSQPQQSGAPAPGTAPAPAPDPAAAAAVPPPDELRFLDPATVAFRLDGQTLQMRGPGESDWREVTLARLFPLSDPTGWLAVADKDDKEVGIVADLGKLAPESVTAVRQALQLRYLVPQIRRIVACRDRLDGVEWTVETDRGETKFLIRQMHENVKQPISGRLMLTDVEGNRYDIPDVQALDPVSRALIEERV